MERKVHGFIFSALLLLSLILSSSLSSTACVLPQESDDQGDQVSTMTSSNDDMIEQALSGFSNLIGMELSDIRKKRFAEANLDYICTQHFNPR